MKHSIIHLSLLGLLACFISSAQTPESEQVNVPGRGHVYCSLRLYGDVDDESGGPYRALNAGPVLSSTAMMGLSRTTSLIPLPAPGPGGKLPKIEHYVNQLTSKDEKGVAATLRLSVHRATLEDQDGNIVKAAQKNCLSSRIWYKQVLVTGMECGFPSSNDPFDPDSGYTPVRLVKGVPHFYITEKHFLETQTKNAVLTTECNSVPYATGEFEPIKPDPEWTK